MTDEEIREIEERAKSHSSEYRDWWIENATESTKADLEGLLLRDIPKLIAALRAERQVSQELRDKWKAKR